MEKNQQTSTSKRQRISPELAEILKMLSALEGKEAQKPDPKAA